MTYLYDIIILIRSALIQNPNLSEPEPGPRNLLRHSTDIRGLTHGSPNTSCCNATTWPLVPASHGSQSGHFPAAWEHQRGAECGTRTEDDILFSQRLEDRTVRGKQDGRGAGTSSEGTLWAHTVGL